MDISIEERRRIAAALEIGDAYLYQILTGRRPAPAELCARIEIESAGVYTRKRLRPEDWALIWPELVGQEERNQKGAEGEEATWPEVDRRHPENAGQFIPPRRRSTDPVELVAREIAPLGQAPEAGAPPPS